MSDGHPDKANRRNRGPRVFERTPAFEQIPAVLRNRDDAERKFAPESAAGQPNETQPSWNYGNSGDGPKHFKMD